jgi:D-aspartate ligase
MSHRGAVTFVLGLGPNGYGLVRSLTIRGVHVVGFHYTDAHFGRFSRLAECHYIDRSLSTEAIADVLLRRRVSCTAQPVLLAASDEFGFTIFDQSAKLASSFSFHVPECGDARQLFSKARMHEACARAGILCPMTVVPASLPQVVEASARLRFPVIVKPVRSFANAFPVPGKNLVVQCAADLFRFYTRNPLLTETSIIQEVIPGGDENVVQCNVLVRQNGELDSMCCVRKLRQNPPGRGNMCYGISETNADAAAAALRLLECCGYRGLASLEFKYHPEERRYYFIEMNPRMPWYCALLPKSGVNLPYRAYLDLTGRLGDDVPPPVQRDGVRWMNASEDLSAVFGGRRIAFGDVVTWLRQLYGTDTFAWWDPTDPAPFAHSTLSVALKNLGAAREMMSRSRFSTRNLGVGNKATRDPRSPSSVTN